MFMQMQTCAKVIGGKILGKAWINKTNWIGFVRGRCGVTKIKIGNVETRNWRCWNLTKTAAGTQPGGSVSGDKEMINVLDKSVM